MQQVMAYLRPDEPNYAEAAARLGEEAVPHLRTVVTQSDPYLAAKAAYLAGRIGSSQAAEAVRAALNHADPIVRVAAAAAAEHLPLQAAETLLPVALRDSDTGVRRVALEVVPRGATAALRSVLEQVQRTDPDAGLRRRSAEVLANLSR